MFKKLLIANRGEIAVRIIRACREFGISTVAVYSDADRAALHVRLSDEAICVGPAPSTESYLRIDKIIHAARRAGAQAIHPGYGFLSENAEFASAVEDAGLTLIGPPASAMKLMGSKTSARQAAQAALAPVVPGTISPLASLDEAYRVAEEIGYPLMLKASAGGGGKGLRLVPSREELKSAFQMAQSEAASSFKDPSVYIEKYLSRPRHIEVQLIGDRHGQMVHLGERECSLQRRHQKVVEECPSPVVDEELRVRMGEAAVSIARAAGYYNAGTIEFLVDAEKNFYFLEMNTRLQVEHPITEMVTGRDLVHEQIRVAAGEKLSFKQDDLVMRGAAIECRIYAEDPHNNFLPSPGRITRLANPTGPGVRLDSGICEGWEVGVHYDPLLAKLCVWAETREMAIRRLARALGEYEIEGIQTSLPFFRAIAQDERFHRADFDTAFLDRHLGEIMNRDANEQDLRLEDMAALAAVLHAKSHSTLISSAPQTTESRWKLYGRLAQRR
ncbi:MAG: acetyl-CoA carboxylase biotin carboxylase subunit [Acidobacteriota bacterium]